MYAGTMGVDFILTFLLVLIWLVAALLVGHTATRRTGRRVRRTARFAVGFVALGLIFTILRVVTFFALASYGWIFVADRKLITVLLLLIPAVTVPFAVIQLRRALHGVSKDADVPPDQRTALAAPSVVVPVQATAWGTLGGFFEAFLSPDGSWALKAVPLFAALAVVAVLLVLRARQRAARLGNPDARLRASGKVWLVRLGTAVAVIAVIMGLSIIGAQSTKLPDAYSMMRGEADFGGGEPFDHTHIAGQHGSSVHTGAPVNVNDLRGPKDGKADRTFTLTAQETQVRLSSGQTVAGWTYNGQVPGPELRVKQGELVEVTLVNKLPSAPVTIHWHGLDVPNGEDGVAGVTQDAVRPGESFTYRFRVEEVGTRWYHSHQAGSEQVVRGLFGPLVIEPADGRAVDQDLAVVLHDWEIGQGILHPAIGGSDTLDRKQIPAGAKVRLRLVNSNNATKTVTLTGTPYRITALDGTDVNAPGELRDNQLVIAAGARYDVEFTQPQTPVRLVDTEAADAGILFSPNGSGDLAAKVDGPEFDPTSYGERIATPFDANSTFDRRFEMLLDEQFGFYNGQFTAKFTVNGKVFPDSPMHLVREGELIRMKFVNRGDEDHPMHVHGHHFLALTKNGKALTGSPMWLDTVNVRPGEIWEIGFRADNPGVWMDHCHQLVHAKQGLVLHLSYENVMTPFQVGGQVGNHPE